ncbi:MAG: DeoR/GlpR family DNA-binding transcription regulator [Spirochaetaceae bacterium]|jgi:DeoR/GlpR family transcriptional regulator of sugar metabolism|nr:DeoR/GlpR family DNA-binding transcription regulator [Spirochaetaceae bacterium]
MDEDLSTLFVEERRGKLLDIIKQKRRVTIVELAEGYNLGEATVRRDLIALENKGLVKRAHGGAILADRMAEEIAYNDRVGQNTKEKQAIAAAMVQYVSDGEAIFLDGGTTTLCVANVLRAKSNLIVLTNSPAVAAEIAEVNGTTALLTGGEYHVRVNALFGPLTMAAIRQFRVDHAILGMSAMMPDQGFFTVSHNEAEVKRSVIDYANKTTVVMDSSKIGKSVFSFVCGFDHIDQLIIDSGVPSKVVETLENKGVEVVIV